MQPSKAKSYAAPLPANESLRLNALASYEILDTPVEADFEDIVRLASHICRAPIAVVNLIDEGRQWFKSEIGLGVRETPIDSSICAHAILQPYLFEIPDTQLDPRFASNPLVTGAPFLRFYAGAPLRTPDGYQLGTICVLDHEPRMLDAPQRDSLIALSRQVMALLELRRAVRNAETNQNHLRQLMTTAGHDLRQPLQTVCLSLELARSKSGDAKTVERHASAALKAAQQLGSGLDELALASTAASAIVKPDLIPISVRERFEDLKSTWEPYAERKNLRLRFAPCSAQVMSNPRMLDTILGNLIGNSIKYTERGGVLVGCRRQRGKIRIDIVDTGMGIVPEQQAAMFEAFRKADVRSDGLGLGLSIVRNTADLLDMPIQMRSIPGRGTVVSLTLKTAADRFQSGLESG